MAPCPQKNGFQVAECNLSPTDGVFSHDGDHTRERAALLRSVHGGTKSFKLRERFHSGWGAIQTDTTFGICRFGTEFPPFVGLTRHSKIRLFRYTLQVVSVGRRSCLPTMLLIVEVSRKKILYRGADDESDDGKCCWIHGDRTL
jgi:hypothetical protein